MTSQENHKAEKAQFVMQPDDVENPTRLFLEIPVETVAQDQSSQGIIFMLGFFENAKNEAIAMVRRKRQMTAQAKSKLIVPGSPPLAVH